MYSPHMGGSDESIAYAIPKQKLVQPYLDILSSLKMYFQFFLLNSQKNMLTGERDVGQLEKK